MDMIEWLTVAELHDAYPEYQWYPGMLTNATHSAENLANQLKDHLNNQKLSSSGDLADFVRVSLVEEGLGVYDATDEEVNRLLDNSDPWPASYIFADMISRRAQVGWTTHGHSGSGIDSIRFSRLTCDSCRCQCLCFRSTPC